MEMPSITWFVFGGGIALWFLSATIAARKVDKKNPRATPKVARYMGLISILMIIVGGYAGFKGPLELPGLGELPQFEFAKTLGKGDVISLKYARANILLTRKPSHGWQGDSASSLQYTVHNAGAKSVGFLILRFNKTDGKSEDVKVHGPFPKGRTVKKTVSLPKDASQDYLKPTTKIEPEHMVGASF